MGMRQHEIRNLKWSAIDLEMGIIFLNGEDQKVRKNPEREIPINKDAYTILMAWSAIPHSEYVFRKRCRHTVNKRWVRLKKDCGVAGRYQDMRHTCISRMIANGIPQVFIQKMLGVSPQVMRRYTHVPREVAQKAVNI
jgi:integrase